MTNSIEHSPALWNRTALSLESDEVLAQILDRGTMDDWRELYRLAGADPPLRARIHQIALRVPLPLPRFWLAALVSIGESVDWNVKIPDYFESSL